MLPEHVELLRHIWKEDTKIKRTVLDEQELEVLNTRMIRAYDVQQVVRIEHYKSGQKLTSQGIVTKLDSLNHRITLKSHDGVLQSIQVIDIYSIT